VQGAGRAASRVGIVQVARVGQRPLITERGDRAGSLVHPVQRREPFAHDLGHRHLARVDRGEQV
jgi:hypothetical protein